MVSHIFIVAFLLWGMDYEDIPIVWGVTVIIPNVLFSLTKNLNSMKFESDHIKLIFNKFFYKKHIESYKYDELLFTYKTECEGKSWGMRFRIYKKGSDKSIISISGVSDGWYEKEIETLIIELEKRGINVITEKSK